MNLLLLNFGFLFRLFAFLKVSLVKRFFVFETFSKTKLFLEFSIIEQRYA